MVCYSGRILTIVKVLPLLNRVLVTPSVHWNRRTTLSSTVPLALHGFTVCSLVTSKVKREYISARKVAQIINMDFNFRLATTNDYEAVMDINRDVYGGFDYLPIMYHTYLKDSWRVMVLAEHDKKVVGFTMFMIIDDGTRVVRQAGRILREYLGKKISTMMTVWATENIINKQYPDIRSHCWTSINKVESEKWVGKDPHYTKLLCVRPTYYFDATYPELRNLVRSGEFQREYDVNKAHTALVLTPDSAAHKLYKNNPERLNPDGVWVINYEVFGVPHWRNYHKMLEDCTTVVTYAESNQGIKAVSFCSTVKCKNGLRVRADFYMDKTAADVSVIKAHLLKHLVLLAQSHTSLPISFVMLVPDWVDVKGMQDYTINTLHLGSGITSDKTCYAVDLRVDDEHKSKL